MLLRCREFCLMLKPSAYHASAPGSDFAAQRHMIEVAGTCAIAIGT
jgi:hypothetical protein